MNRLESFIYHRVKRNPRLKRVITGTYRTIFSLLPSPRCESDYDVKSRSGYFFGFHDKCPWSADNKKLLGHHADFDFHPPETGDAATVGYFEGDRFTPVGATRSWNFQQGSMLQWVGATKQIIFNDYDGADNIARIVDADSREMRSLPIAIGAIDPKGEHSVGFNFPRLQRYFIGYGYANGTDPEIDVERPQGHGISVCNIASGEGRRLFSVAGIADLSPERTMQDSFHCLRHTVFSPSGNRFAFIHTWVKPDGRVWTRLLTSDLSGNVFPLPTHEMVSHLGWRDDEHVFAYARTRQWGDGYFLFRDLSDEVRPIGRKSFSSDGHPMFAPGGRYFVTDTYPDRRRYASLIVYDTKLNVRHDLGRFLAPARFASRRHEDLWRCDLHPRWNRDGTAICFDSAHSGTRSLCTIELGDRFMAS